MQDRFELGKKRRLLPEVVLLSALHADESRENRSGNY